jgi:hypothetical protein
VSLNLSSYSLFFLLVFSFFPLLFELISFYYPFPLLLAFTFGISQHSFPGYHRDYSLHPWLIHISIFTTSWTMQRTSFVLIIFKLLNIYIYRKRERKRFYIQNTIIIQPISLFISILSFLLFLFPPELVCSYLELFSFYHLVFCFCFGGTGVWT